jgi:MFS transporter, YNFM family, putative membrane transport protein
MSTPSVAPQMRIGTGVTPGHSQTMRLVLVGMISFLTLVDLFAAQAILPTLTATYSVTPAEMGFAVNAATIGLAVSGVLVALFGQGIDRRHGVWISLACLSVPTGLLGAMPDLMTFTMLRIAQGVFMCAAFTLTLAYLAETGTGRFTAAALAAYVTGNVASNLFGRLFSAAVAEHLGLPANFYLFALLNLTGAALAFYGLRQMQPASAGAMMERQRLLAIWASQFRDPALVSSFAIGFLILFAFIGTFTYVNFYLVEPLIGLGPMQLGFVYLVFAPSMLTTPVAGRIASKLGARTAIWTGTGIALVGMPLIVQPTLVPVLIGLSLIGVGTFFAQATATGYVSRTARSAAGSAGGIYLASYYIGGLVGSAVLGRVYDGYGWTACVAVIAASLALCLVLALSLRAAAP